MNEKLIEKKLRETVKKMGGLALKIWCLSFAGFPDRIVLMPGARIWFVELKSTGKKLSPRQLIVLRLLDELDFTVVIIDREEALNVFFQLISHATK